MNSRPAKPAKSAKPSRPAAKPTPKLPTAQPTPKLPRLALPAPPKPAGGPKPVRLPAPAPNPAPLGVDPRVALGVGLVGSIAALAATSVVAGLELERRVFNQSLRGRGPGTGEPFFSLHSPGPEVITPDGLRMHVEVDELDAYPRTDGRTGEYAGATVIFVHGYVLSLDCFHFQRAHFRGLSKLVLYDQRSHGRTGRSPAEHCRVPQLARDLSQIIEATTAPDEKVVLVGHSMGGMTIQELAKQRPEWFGEKVVGTGLICTSPGNMTANPFLKRVPGPMFLRVADSVLSVLNRVPGLVDKTLNTPTDVSWLTTKRLAFGSDVPPDYVAFMSEMIGRTGIEVVNDYWPAIREFEGEPAFPVLNRIESAVIGGVDDHILSIAHSDRIVQLLPGADYRRIEDGGHMTQIEHHGEVNEALDAMVHRALHPVDQLSAR